MTEIETRPMSKHCFRFITLSLHDRISNFLNGYLVAIVTSIKLNVIAISITVRKALRIHRLMFQWLVVELYLHSPISITMMQYQLSDRLSLEEGCGGHVLTSIVFWKSARWLDCQFEQFFSSRAEISSI